VVRAISEAAPGLGIGTLTLFAFSADNWARPRAEVAGLMRLFRFHLSDLAAEVASDPGLRGLRLTVIGDRAGLPATLRQAIACAEGATRRGTDLHLRLALNYSARDAILAAARSQLVTTRDEFARALGEAVGEQEPVPDVDLLIRTGGEQRLSDFLLWECAYAELLFTPTMWPDFGPADLEAAVQEFRQRQRRFGRVV
jgi:undecaprenyl diphosphate synthase